MIRTTIAPILSEPTEGMSAAAFEEQFGSVAVERLTEKHHCTEEDALALSSRVLRKLKRSQFNKSSRQETVLWQEFFKIAEQEVSLERQKMDKNFGLTEPAFLQLVTALQAGDDQLFKQVFLAQFKDCCRYLTKNYKATSQDAYDVSMDTLVEFHKRLMSGKIAHGNLRYLFVRMAGQAYLKWVKKDQRHEDLGDFDLPEAPVEMDEASLTLLDKAWAGLCSDCQLLLKSFYHQAQTLEQLSKNTGDSAAAVRKRKQRCVEKLRDLFKRLS